MADGTVPCPECGGDGVLEYDCGFTTSPWDTEPVIDVRPCPHCNGRGTIASTKEPSATMEEPILETREDAIELCEALYGLDTDLLTHLFEDYDHEDLLSEELLEQGLAGLHPKRLARLVASIGYNALSDEGVRLFALEQHRYEVHKINMQDFQGYGANRFLIQ